MNPALALWMQPHDNHKVKSAHLTSVAGGVKKRLETNIQNKRMSRSTSFDNFRNLPENEPVQGPLNKMAQRKLKLQKWKKEKEKRKAEALANKKKPFVVGIPKTSIGFEPPPTVSGPLPSTSGKSKITNNGNKEKQKMDINSEKLVNLCSTSMETDTDEKPTDTTYTIMITPTNSEILVNLCSTSMETDTDGKPTDTTYTIMTPQEIKEEVKKISRRVYLYGLFEKDNCDMTVKHYQRQLLSEIQRVAEMCAEWDEMLEQMTVPDEIRESVLAAVREMSRELWQFESLLRRSVQTEPRQALVTSADLQGLWARVFLQMQNVGILFKKLEQLRAEGAPSAAGGDTSRLRDIVAAAMKAKQTNSDTTKTCEAEFFSAQSPVKSPAAATPPPRTTSLLQSVLSDEAKKASAKKANLVPTTPINLGLTPGKSILKSNNNTSTKVASKISFKPFNMDTGSDSSPTSDDRQISGMEKLLDLDSSQNLSESSPAKLHDLDNLHSSDNLHSPDRTEEEKKENKGSSRKKKETLHNAEDNAVIMDIEGEEKESDQSSRKKRETNNNECEEAKESRQSSRGRPILVRQYAVDEC